MNLLSLLAGQTKRDPHAIIAIDADPDRPQHVSRAELWRRTLQLRADLATAGVGRGDGVLVVLPATSSMLDWQVATASLGAHVVPADPGLAPGELADVLRRVRPKVVAVTTGDSPVLGRAVLHEAVRRCEPCGGMTPTVAVVTAPGAVPPVDPSPYDVGAGAWLPSAPTVGMPMPQVRGDEFAVAFLPELAAYRQSALTTHASATSTALRLAADDVVLYAGSPADPAWLVFALAAVASGATCLFEPSPTPAAVLADVARFGVTHVACDAGFLHALTGEAAGAGSLSSWRWLGVLGHPARDPGAISRAEEVFGLAATACYGPPETLPPAALWSGNDSPEVRRQAGGRPVGADVELRVVDPRSGVPVAVGSPGEIQVRGHLVAESGLDSADTLARRRTPDGWLRTGDAGVEDPGGSLRHTGRITADSRD
ncbi:AMP-binding protein [Saccharomonospora xinjiangensis]|uniref:AMP-binding protein n=1 Tax=Saccharomonospora xinjiangensis TaxID=75294 RepID=UPI0010702F3C|nr:AMP-binding protein [Saccharomonospora xinjiangensis]QBQ61035.1 Long-chain-fatty-acid--CoA ligase [Saccharomonospora xinjiangensis]